MKLIRNSYIFSSLLLVPLIFSGCSSREGPQWDTKKRPRTYKMATRQLPPQPVYGATRWVRPPEMTPDRRIESSKADLVVPILDFSVKDAPLSEAILVLGATARYRTYCSSIIADKKLTLTTIGTITEIATAIEKSADIKVALDHQNKEIRFLPKRDVEPSLNEVIKQ